MPNHVVTIEHADTTLHVDLKDPRMGAFLAWLVPGLGHLYQGRTSKAVLFFVCIVGTFFYGLYIGGGRVVYASHHNMLARWQYFCQLGVGLPATPALIQRQRARQNRMPLFHDNFMRPPYLRPEPTRDHAGNLVHHPDELAKWNYDLGEWFEMGTMFTVIAGLLNVLAIYDAYGGPLVFPPPDDKKKKRHDDDDGSE